MTQRAERLVAALEPFANFADYMDSETEGFTPGSKLDIGVNGHVLFDFKLSDFQEARAVLQSDALSGLIKRKEDAKDVADVLAELEGYTPPETPQDWACVAASQKIRAQSKREEELREALEFVADRFSLGHIPVVRAALGREQ